MVTNRVGLRFQKKGAVFLTWRSAAIYKGLAVSISKRVGFDFYTGRSVFSARDGLVLFWKKELVLSQKGGRILF